jgi:hypothetical protein
MNSKIKIITVADLIAALSKVEDKSMHVRVWADHSQMAGLVNAMGVQPCALSDESRQWIDPTGTGLRTSR